MAENDSCHNVATCQDDEVCFTQKYQTEDNKTRFDVGCSYPELCRKNSMGTIFGKRAAGLGHVLCHHCCTENVCNSAFTCTDNFKAPTLSCMYCSGIDMIGKCNSTITCTNDENQMSMRPVHQQMAAKAICCVYLENANALLMIITGQQIDVKYVSLDRNVDTACVSSYECREPLICLDNVCKCPKDEYWDGSHCRPKRQLNSICKTSEECSDTLFCIHGVCKCDRIDYWTGHNCSTSKTEGQSCSSSNECSRFLYCLSTDPHDVNKTVCAAANECADIPFVHNDVFYIHPKVVQHPMLAYCVIEAGIKWTVIQRRTNGSVDFNRNWQEYKEGFGNVLGEYWLGNDVIHSISTNGRHKLRVNLEEKSNGKYYAEYSTFRLEDEHSNYLLHVTGYSGTAGDSMENVGNSNGQANGAVFSTKDRNNDRHECAKQYFGGWWYVNCYMSNLNGRASLNATKPILAWALNLGNRVKKSMMLLTKY
ncbi:Hypothetical predicted protein [Mytilus galloprovincialis]|uniref:Fibrinogen C-terminal domain-containing protein n=1 Tax=Mytilus galloprovincialis TaxID=29158 RepID=A0A8B6EE22_MYTGA|nr:Hypothetical predicted protein [Mytilus galloprovincialis]